MSPSTLLKHNLVLYRDDPDYIKALLNLGWGILVVIKDTNINHGLSIIYRDPEYNWATIPELDYNQLYSINDAGINLSDIRYYNLYTKERSFLYNSYYVPVGDIDYIIPVINIHKLIY